MEQQEIIWVRFPYSDFSQQKTRPALIVSNNNYNEKANDIVICAITSNTEQTPYSVLIDQHDISRGTLKIPCKIRADKIIQINKKFAFKAFAKLGGEKFNEVTNQLAELISKKPRPPKSLFGAHPEMKKFKRDKSDFGDI